MPPTVRCRHHPLRLAILEAGWPNYTTFWEAIDVPAGTGSAVINYRLAPSAPFRAKCAAELGRPESELFPVWSMIAERVA